MKKYATLSISLFIWHISVFVYAQSPEEKFTPERFLPENTLAVCVFTNLQKTVEAFKHTLLGEVEGLRTHSAEGPKTGLQSGRRNFRSFAEEFRKNAGFSLFEIWSIFHKSLAIALIDMSREEVPETTMRHSGLVVIAEVTGSVEVLKNLLENSIVRNIQRKEPTVECLVESFAGTNIYVLANRQFQIYYTFLDNIFVLTLKRDAIQQVIAVSNPVLNLKSNEGENIEGYSTSSLYNALPYRSTTQYAVDVQHEARVYVDIRNVWLELRPSIYQACSSKHFLKSTIILNLLDHYSLQSLFWTFSYEDRGVYETLFFRVKNQIFDENLVFPANSTDFLPTLSNIGNTVFTSDLIVPANVIYYGAGKVNILEVWQQFLTLINASPYPHQIEQFHGWVESIEEVLDLDIEQDLLAVFGQEIAFACQAGEFRHRFVRKKSSLETFPFLMLIQVKDKDILERMLRKVSGSLHIESHKEIYQHVEIQSLDLPGKIAPFTLYLAFIKGFLLVSGSRAVVQEVIAVSQHGGSLAMAEDYRRLSASFPVKGYSKGYVNIKRVSRLILRFLERKEQSALSSLTDILIQTLHPIVFAEKFPGMMWLTTVVKDGFLTKSFSPVGGTVVGIGVIWLVLLWIN